MKIEIENLDDLEKFMNAENKRAETALFNRQKYWHPAAVITGIVLTSVGFTLAMLKLLAII